VIIEIHKNRFCTYLDRITHWTDSNGWLVSRNITAKQLQSKW